MPSKNPPRPRPRSTPALRNRVCAPGRAILLPGTHIALVFRLSLQPLARLVPATMRPAITSVVRAEPTQAGAGASVRRRSLACFDDCSPLPIDIQTQSDRVYVLKHRGPRKRTGGRSNPEVRQKSGSLETAYRRLPGTSLV